MADVVKSLSRLRFEPRHLFGRAVSFMRLLRVAERDAPSNSADAFYS
jgi:hypothetical protein